MSFTEGLIVVVMAALITVGISVVMAFPTMWLWNWLMPVIFELPKITVWQALGLNVLSALLVKSHTSIKKEK